MKKETKRYLIVEYAGSKERVYDTLEEVKIVLDDIRKYNNRKTAKYICGNIDIKLVDGKYYVNIHLYHKFSSKHTISAVDEFTKNFSKSELQAYYTPASKMKDGYESDINIAYFETKDATSEDDKPLLYGIKYIPVLYKENLKYFDESYIKKCLRYHANISDTRFFRNLANEFSFYHVVSDEVEKLFVYCDKVDNQGYDTVSLYYVSLDLYKKLIYEREKDGSLLRDSNGKYQISNRRKRDFVFFLKNYNCYKINSPLRYNGSTTKMMKDSLIKVRNELLKKEEIKKLELK